MILLTILYSSAGLQRWIQGHRVDVPAPRGIPAPAAALGGLFRLHGARPAAPGAIFRGPGDMKSRP